MDLEREDTFTIKIPGTQAEEILSFLDRLPLGYISNNKTVTELYLLLREELEDVR